MAGVEFKPNERFVQFVEYLSGAGYFNLSSNKVISFSKEELNNTKELGFFIFLVVVYSSIYRNLKVLLNESQGDKYCVLFFPSKNLHQVFLNNFDSITFELPDANKKLTKFEYGLVKENYRVNYPKTHFPENIKKWKNIYNLIKNNKKYICLLGGSGLIFEIDPNNIKIFLKDIPSWNEAKTSEIFDTILTILKAGYYSDSNIYSANFTLRKPFKSYEIDSCYIKTDGTKLNEAEGTNIPRLIVTESTIGSDLNRTDIVLDDFFEKKPNNKKTGNFCKVLIDGEDYVHRSEENNTAFRNKLLTWLAFNNIGSKQYCYILLILKSGISDPKFLNTEATATTHYCMSKISNFEIVELDKCPANFFKDEVNKIVVKKKYLYQKFNNLIKKYFATLKKYK